MIISVYNCFVMPVDIAFSPQSLDNSAGDIWNYIQDVFFAVDILFNFRTTVIDDLTGEEISNPKEIAKNYLKGRFFIDVLATPPFDKIFSGVGGSQSKSLVLLSLLKLFRLFRLSKIITYMNTSESVKHSLKIFKLIFFLILYLHFQGCFWFFIVNQDQTWFP